MTQSLSKSGHKPDMSICVCNPSISQAEEGGSWVCGQSGLDSKTRSQQTKTENQEVAGQTLRLKVTYLRFLSSSRAWVQDSTVRDVSVKPAHSSSINVTGCKRDTLVSCSSALTSLPHKSLNPVYYQFRFQGSLLITLNFPSPPFYCLPLYRYKSCFYQVWVRWERKQYGPNAAPLKISPCVVSTLSSSKQGNLFGKQMPPQEHCRSAAISWVHGSHLSLW